jgi:hypothetical protein
MPEANIQVRKIKLTAVVKPEEIPRDVIPMEGPAGELTLHLGLEESPICLMAKLNGKNYRKMLKTIDANHGNVSIVLQGNMEPILRGGKIFLESAGFQVMPKAKPQTESVS